MYARAHGCIIVYFHFKGSCVNPVDVFATYVAQRSFYFLILNWFCCVFWILLSLFSIYSFVVIIFFKIFNMEDQIEYDDIQCMELLDSNYQYYTQLVPTERYCEATLDTSIKVAAVRYIIFIKITPETPLNFFKCRKMYIKHSIKSIYLTHFPVLNVS